MRIHSSTCANTNTPGEQADNGLHSFIHSFIIRSFIHPILIVARTCALLKLTYLVSDLTFKVSIMQGDRALLDAHLKGPGGTQEESLTAWW